MKLHRTDLETPASTPATYGGAGNRWLTGTLIAGGLLVAASLQAQLFERVQPKLPGDTGILDTEAADSGRVAGEESDPALQGVSEARRDAVILKELKGIVFVQSVSEVKRNGADASGVVAEGVLDVLSGEMFTEEVASKYLWQELTLRKLNQLNRDTVSFLSKRGYPVVDVIIPEQDVTRGTVQLIVLKGTVGAVNFTGNEHFSTERLQSIIRTQPGEVISGQTVREDLNWINRNPFRDVNLLYSRGAEFGQTDLNFQVEDRRPVRFYVGYENSGTESTDIDRYLAGVNFGNVFGLDHQVNYQFTGTDDLDDFYAHSASYLAPLPWRHLLSVYGAFANSTAEVAAGLLDAEGESYTGGLRYTIPLKSTERFNHEVYVGYEYKYSENGLVFGGATEFETETEVSHFNGGYSAALRDAWGATSLNATLYYSPGGMFSHNDDEDFSMLYDADSEYTYGRIALSRTTRLPQDFSLLTSITGQLSSENLLVSEQLGAGGYSTVRGYNERVANADEGIITTLELRTPSFNLPEIRVIDRPLPRDQMQLLAFWDYAQLERKNPDPAGLVPDSYSLSSAGVGLRYSMSEYLSVRFDYGWQLKDSAVGERGDSRGHVGVILSY